VQACVEGVLDHADVVDWLAEDFLERGAQGSGRELDAHLSDRRHFTEAGPCLDPVLRGRAAPPWDFAWLLQPAAEDSD